MNGSVFLALDSSCYTTSYALWANESVKHDARKLLEVPQGARGLRQSEMVFQHVRNYGMLFSDFPHEGQTIRAVAYSEKPCPREGSYMPAFLAGKSLAVAIAASMGVPAYALTHQHGHIYSGFIGNDIQDGEFCALHASGGTLDILNVHVAQGIVETITPMGGTADVTCGQIIDRIGVAAGLAFPAGAEMERVYTPNGIKLSVHVEGLKANLSGAETQAMRLLENGCDRASVFSGVLDCAAETLAGLTGNALEQTKSGRFLFTGGVICNRIVRERLQKACEDRAAQAIFAQKQYCGDNACGLALAAQRVYERGESA